MCQLISLYDVAVYRCTGVIVLRALNFIFILQRNLCDSKMQSFKQKYVQKLKIITRKYQDGSKTEPVGVQASLSEKIESIYFFAQLDNKYVELFTLCINFSS